jgi:hypothetical protein
MEQTPEPPREPGTTPPQSPPLEDAKEPAMPGPPVADGVLKPTPPGTEATADPPVADTVLMPTPPSPG